MTKITSPPPQKRVKYRTFWGGLFMKKDRLVIYDRTASLSRTIEEATNQKWPSWKKGEQVRDRIMELKKENPDLSIEQICLHTGLSRWQVQRHKQKLIACGLWKICGYAIALTSSFIAGAYYADAETIDEWVTERVKCRILSMQEEILWELEQRKFL